jgi:hypothetical protein
MSPHEQTTGSDPVTLPQWQIVEHPDGSLRLRMAEQARRPQVWFHAAFAIGWNAFVVFFLLNHRGWGRSLGDYAFVSIFGGIGLLVLFGLFNSILRREEWFAGPNALEYRSGWWFSRPSKWFRYENGWFELRSSLDEGKEHHCLDYKCPGGWWKQGSFASSHGFPDHTLAQLQQLGEMLAAHTGWPLMRIDEINEAEDEGPNLLRPVDRSPAGRHLLTPAASGEEASQKSLLRVQEQENTVE